MGELYEPYPRLPKHIRQIGERDEMIRLYVEDYVNTYLKRLFPVGGQDLRTGILLGSTEEHGGVPYVFIDGALEVEGVTFEGEKVEFSEEVWKKTYQMVEEMFPKRTIQGWFLCSAPGSQLSPLNYWKQHGKYFNGKNQMMYMNCGLEGEEAFYITASDGFYKLQGHCIYYERNQMMQDYMVKRKGVSRVEAGGSDPVIRNFRRKMEEKKEETVKQNHTITFLKGLCSCLAIMVLAGGIVTFNSVEKLRDMESVMASAFPQGQSQSQNQSQEHNPQAVIEEIPAGIFPLAPKETESQSPDKLLTPLEMPGEGSAEAAGAPGGLGEAGETSVSAPAPALEETSPAAAKSGEEEKAAQETKAAREAEVFRQIEPLPGQTVYTVQEGETLYGICFKLYQNLSNIDEICRINGITDMNMLEAGQRLIVP